MLVLDQVIGLNTFGFEAFGVLKILEINKKDIEYDWDYIVNGLPLIPSTDFRSLRIKTDVLRINQVI